MKFLNLIPLFFLFFLSTNIFGQSVDLEKEVKEIYANINKTKATTGFLKNQGLFLIDPEPYNGKLSSSTFMDEYTWEVLNRGWLSARLTNKHNNYYDATNVLRDIQNQLIDEKVAHLPISLVRYNQISSTAASNNYYLYQNEQLVDNYSSNLNPFEEKYFFSAYLPQQKVYRGELKIKITNDYFFSNHAGTLSSIEFDAGNGLGYQRVTLGSTKTFSYATTGSKTWKLRVKYNVSGQIKTYETQGKTYVVSKTCSNCRYTIGNVDLETILTARTTFGLSNARAQGRIRVFRDGDQIDKPFIVFGGYGLEGMEYGDDFVETWLDDNNPEGPMQVGTLPTSLNDNLFDDGYDIIFVDYLNAGDFIQNNALLAQRVIEWVNDQKVGNEPNVVMGISMGGLVANFALRSMELAGVNHDTRLFMTMDSPHRGANVPLSLIALTQRAFEVYGDNPFHSLRQYQEMLFSNSARQMLINYVNAESVIVTKDNSMHEAFMNEYHGAGRPQNCRVVALSNSANRSLGNGWNGIYPGSDLIDISASCKASDLVDNAVASFFLKVLGVFISSKGSISLNLKALSSQSKQITDFNINFKVKVLLIWEKTIYNQDIEYTSENGELPWDSAHGGLIGEGFGGVPNLNEKVDELDFGCINVNENLNNFCFIPQVSALNITPANNGKYTEAQLKKTYNVQNDLAFIDFDNIYTEPLGNQMHTRFTQAAGDFIWTEISNQQESADYSKFASFTSGLSINSSSCIADGTSLSLSKPSPAGLQLSYKWEVLNVESATVSNSNLKSASVSNVKDDDVFAIIRCTISGPYHTGNFNWTFVVDKRVTTNTHNISVQEMPPFNMCRTSSGNFENVIELTGLQGTSSPNIVLTKEPTSVDFAYYISGTKIYLIPNRIGKMRFRVNVINDCGGSNYMFFFINVSSCSGGGGGGFPFSLYPVPSSTELNIAPLQAEENIQPLQLMTMNSSLETNDVGVIKNSNRLELYSILIINEQGEEVKRLENVELDNNLSLNLNGLRNGFYYIRIFNKEKDYMKRIEIRK
ncbi:T9SS type A sorting domain-containing protein [Flammeovirga sp. SJP92]|uniref:T9SS type A sorting domain-containing protein n=1 Tax=Flammeovirga sp. SJP92 TaxID=1775430 RepID=UPI0007881F47|nr:T9SS type A sorting domain-containing protein [Flammeovirga sp. SJP92]KXX71763.1 hypothetical protein AVL50_02980 [Flammeovirga sp. SJP92]